MRVLHVGPFKMHSANGLYRATWEYACALAANGHHVCIARLGKEVSPEDAREAATRGVTLVGLRAQRGQSIRSVFTPLLDRTQPDVVHFEYVRLPHTLSLSAILNGRGIPFVVSLHGGMNPVEMTRKRVRKLAHWYLLERRVHKRATAIHFTTTKEQSDYYRSFGRPREADRVVSPIVDVAPREIRWSPPEPGEAALVYMGRYDVWHKGLDLALALLRSLRSHGIGGALHLIGEDMPERYGSSFPDLLREYSDLDVVDHGLMSGAPRFERLSKATAYVAYSRFESFGLSMLEAMSIGMPAFVSENCDLAADLAAEHAAVILPMDPQKAAEVVQGYFSDVEDLRTVASNGRRWVLRNCQAGIVGEKLERFYEAVLGSRSQAR